MKSNILVTGCNGQLGSEIRELSGTYPQYGFVFTDLEELDITDRRQVGKYMKTHNISCVINCAAYTAVDKAEEEIEKARLINKTGAAVLADATNELHALLVHISTDYVYDGRSYKPYTETDNTNPKSFYGKTKLEGELEIVFNAAKAVIIRTSWLYSSFGNNFVKTIIRKARETGLLKVVTDQIGTPTYAKDLACTILDIIPQCQSVKRTEIYNYSNEGVISWFDFAKTIIELTKISCEVVAVETKDYPTAAARPFYSVLNKAKMKKDFNITIPYWKDSLKDCLTKQNL